MRSVTKPQLAFIAVSVAAILVLRLVFGTFSLQGLLYIIVTAIAAAQFGPGAAIVSSTLGFAAIHVRVFVQSPSLLEMPSRLLTRQYFSGIGIYVLISGLLIVASRRHYRILEQLERERGDKERGDQAHHKALEASLARETAAREKAQQLHDEAEAASRLKDEFLATLSHELRTPLNAILGYARMLKSGMLDGDRQTRGLEILERNATSLTHIVEDVLDVSRIISGKIRLKVEHVELSAIVAHGVATVQPAADAKGVRIHTRIARQAAFVSADRDRLQQVVWNVLSNAVKFTPRGGRVDISIEIADTHVALAVRDSGIGIAPEFLPHVFERFRQADSRYSREHGGLGLGLAICRHIVEMHGGTMTATSAGRGRGSTFSVELPLVAVAPIDQNGEPSEAVASGTRTGAILTGLRIVAVDDDADGLILVSEMLEAAGAQVATACCGEDALSLVSLIEPDVLITDLGMPGMDGFQLLERVRQLTNPRLSGMAVAALTAYARSEDRGHALEAGFQAHLAKPIDPGELLAAVSSLTQRGSTISSAR
jgi:signal transduction histidine kinase/ActR/RegA family two-component response regulator